jgi:preprotein translocase subunit SecE
VTNPLIAKQRIEDAQKAVRDVLQKRQEEATENKRAVENFYRNLALLSGGTIALSVTYLGFLKSITNRPLHSTLLIVSWALLFLCLASATYYTFFASTYTHYARIREYAQRLKEQHETIADEVGNVQVVGIQTKAELDDYIKELRDAAAKREEDVSWGKRKEKMHAFLFIACGVIARTTFVLGIALLLLFAVANLNLSNKSQSTTVESNEYECIERTQKEVQNDERRGTHSEVDYVLLHDSHKIYASCDVTTLDKLDSTATCGFRPLRTYECAVQPGAIRNAKVSEPLSDLKCKDGDGHNVYLYVSKKE